MDDRKILDLYPLPLARGYRRCRNASEARERHDAAYYLYEVYLKYFAAMAIASYLAGEGRDHRVNAALKGLARPSLGEWLGFLREVLGFLGRGDTPRTGIAALAGAFESKESRGDRLVDLFNALRSFRSETAGRAEKVSLRALLEEIVIYRNRVIGHGAPLVRSHYERFGELLGGAFPQLLESSPFLTALKLVTFDSIRVEAGSRIECAVVEYMSDRAIRSDKPLVIEYGKEAPEREKLYLVGPDGDLLCLDPLLIVHDEDVYFLNDAGGRLEYLSYSTGARYESQALPERQRQLLGHVLGYRVDSRGLSRLEGDLALPAEKAEAVPEAAERRLGDYRIVREIGHGGMGTVFEAVQESLGRRVALKVLSGAFALDPTRVERFRREARATARMHHPSIVPIYEVGEVAGSHYYAMEYIGGTSLDRRIAEIREAGLASKKAPSSAESGYVREVAERMAELAQGLGLAHEQGLVHRDVKPSNILVDPGGRYVLIDFGLVREVDAQVLTRSGEMIGTIPYMSPEQISRRPAGPASDVYSLGATLYEALTLRPPFAGESEHEVQNGILFEEPALPRRLNPRIPRDRACRRAGHSHRESGRRPRPYARRRRRARFRPIAYSL